jgi:hypothetical protein
VHEVAEGSQAIQELRVAYDRGGTFGIPTHMAGSPRLITRQLSRRF